VSAPASVFSEEQLGPGWIDQACWLTGDVLLLCGWLGAPEGERPEGWLDRDGEVIPLDIRALAYPRADVALPDAGRLLVARVLGGAAIQERLGVLVLRAGDDVVSPGPAELSGSLVDLDVAAGSLALIAHDFAEPVAAFLGTLAASPGSLDEVGFEASLGVLLARLREQRFAPTAERWAVRGERLFQIDETSFYLTGWLHDEHADVTRFTAISPEGLRAELLGRTFRYRRLDIEQVYALAPGRSGFVAYFTLDGAGNAIEGWTLELEDAAGAVLMVAAPPVVREPVALRDALIGDLALAGSHEDELMADHVYPAMSRLQERIHSAAVVERVVQYGRAASVAPDVSVVIPLYRRVDLLEHQLAQFADDPSIREADLIYVLDSPEHARGVEVLGEGLFELYRVPFRLVILAENVGFSGATNAGASLARGRLLLFLNSDVVPVEPGWLDALSTFYDVTPRIGALGPKLLFEDDSLQHAGMYFRRAAGTQIWENAHYYKGLHRTFPEANVARPVPAVSAACMMIDRELFEDIGGLRGLYVQGDYEDSDLCLRLLEQGLESWYLPEVELYHLEGQSYPSQLRRLTSQYNAWHHTYLWRERIEELVGDEPVRRSSPGPQAAPTTPRAPEISATRPPATDAVGIKDELRALIVRSVGVPYISASPVEGIKTGNNYQSVALGDTRTNGFRTPRADLLDQVDFRDKRVLDLGSNLGELSREARRRDAALVDGFEYDQFFLDIGNAVNAYNDITRVSFYQRDLSDRTIYDEHYDIVLAFSVFPYIQPSLDRIAEITDGVLVLETHKLEDNLESYYLKHVLPHFPYYKLLGETEWGTRHEPSDKRAVLAFAKDPAALDAALLPGAAAQPQPTLGGQAPTAAPTAGDLYADAARTGLQERFFSAFEFDSPDDLLAAVAGIELDLDRIARSRDSQAYEYLGWVYWLLFLKGCIQYADRGLAGPGNVHYDYLTGYFFDRQRDPRLARAAVDPEVGLATVVERRFRDFEFFRSRAGEDVAEEVAPIRVYVPNPPPEYPNYVYVEGSDEPLPAARLDGWHRLFLARVFGTPRLRCTVLREEQPLPHIRGNIEEFRHDGRSLRVHGWCLRSDRRIDALEVRVGGRRIQPVGMTERPDVAGHFPDIPDALHSGFAVDCEWELASDEPIAFELVALSDWISVGVMRAYLLPQMLDERTLPAPLLAWAELEAGDPFAVASRSAKRLHELLAPLGRHRRLDSFESVLDWGVGSSLLQFFLPDFLPRAVAIGVDSDPDAVERCRRCGLPGEFHTVAPLPPTGLPAESVDLALACTALRTLDPEGQAAWLDELARLVRPGGYVVASVHGELLRPFQDPAVRERLDAEGVSNTAGGGTHQTMEYTLREFSRRFEVLEYVAGGVDDLADLLVMRRP